MFVVDKKPVELEENIAGLICYILGWISGLVFILREKKNKFVRFHAIQSIVVFGAITILFIVIYIISSIITGMFRFIPGFGFTVSAIFSIIYFLLFLSAVLLWMVLMAQAYQGKKYKLPWAGNFAEKRIR
jgi:uncharacterized membrane protein